jgi:osmoprotectant transport system permease protein
MGKGSLAALVVAALTAICPVPVHAADEVLRIGSKRFTEAYILAEVLAQTAAPHAKAEIRQGLGNTAIVFEALRSGNIDLYPDYLGTIDLEILKNPTPTTLENIRAGSPSGGWASPCRWGSTTAMRWPCTRARRRSWASPGYRTCGRIRD